MTAEKRRIIFDSELEPGVNMVAEVLAECGEDTIYTFTEFKNRMYVFHFQRAKQERGYSGSEEAEYTMLFINELDEALQRARDILREEGRDTHSLLQSKKQKLEER